MEIVSLIHLPYDLIYHILDRLNYPSLWSFMYGSKDMRIATRCYMKQYSNNNYIDHVTNGDNAKFLYYIMFNCEKTQLEWILSYTKLDINDYIPLWKYRESGLPSDLLICIYSTISLLVLFLFSNIIKDGNNSLFKWLYTQMNINLNDDPKALHYLIICTIIYDNDDILLFIYNNVKTFPFGIAFDYTILNNRFDIYKIIYNLYIKYIEEIECISYTYNIHIKLIYDSIWCNGDIIVFLLNELDRIVSGLLEIHDLLHIFIHTRTIHNNNTKCHICIFCDAIKTGNTNLIMYVIKLLDAIDDTTIRNNSKYTETAIDYNRINILDILYNNRFILHKPYDGALYNKNIDMLNWLNDNEIEIDYSSIYDKCIDEITFYDQFELDDDGIDSFKTFKWLIDHCDIDEFIKTAIVNEINTMSIDIRKKEISDWLIYEKGYNRDDFILYSKTREEYMKYISIYENETISEIDMNININNLPLCVIPKTITNIIL